MMIPKNRNQPSKPDQLALSLYVLHSLLTNIDLVLFIDRICSLAKF